MKAQRLCRFACMFIVIIALTGCLGTAQTPPPAPEALTKGTNSALPTDTQPATAATPTVTTPPQPTTTEAPKVIARIKVSTYNILYGGGFDERVPANQRLENRIKGILEYIAAESPDILGLQELQGWELGDPMNSTKFGSDLHMNNFLAIDPSGFHNGLLTKYEILEARNLSPMIGDDGGLYARLKSPIGPIHVFNIHNTPKDPNAKACKVQKLLQLAEKYKNEPTILMGDFNDFPDFVPNGWVNPINYSKRSIDQIWVSPVFKATYEVSKTSPEHKYDSTALYDGKQLYELSDHAPVTRIFNIEAILPGTKAPQPPEGQAVPSPIQAILNQTELLDFGPFNQCSGSLGWNAGTAVLKGDAGFALTGKNNWSDNFSFRSPLLPGQGLLVDFTYAGNQPEFEIYLNTGEWQNPNYRRFGAYIRDGKISQNDWAGPNRSGSAVLPDSPALEPGHTYSFFLGMTQDNKFLMVIWDKAAPDQYAKVIEDMGAEAGKRDWYFSIGANKGEIIFSDFYFLSFDRLK